MENAIPTGHVYLFGMPHKQYPVLSIKRLETGMTVEVILFGHCVVNYFSFCNLCEDALISMLLIMKHPYTHIRVHLAYIDDSYESIFGRVIAEW